MHQTIPQMVFERIERFDRKTVLRHKANGHYQDINWQQLGEQIRSFATGLIACGLQPQQQVAILAPNRPEWVYADQAIMSIGCRTVPIYHTEGLKTILHILADSQSRLLFTHSLLIAKEILEQRTQCPELQKIILLEGSSDIPDILPLKGLLVPADTATQNLFEELLQKGQSCDLATLVYTSGTTGKPKGAMLTHANILSNVEACCQRFKIGTEDQCLSFLPLSHIFERMAGYYLMLRQGVTIAYAESISTVTANLIEIRPTIIISVPRIYEKMYARVLERVTTGPWLKKHLFFFAFQIGIGSNAREKRGLPPTALQNILLKLFDRLVFGKIRERLGGRLRILISGGAPLIKEIIEFFLAAGIPIYQGYGLTETAPVIAVNFPGQNRLGTVGPPLPNLQLQIAADGELLVKGPGIFQGYWQQPEQTTQALQNGWFHTGDVAQLDADGFLSITDRKKDLIVTAGGKNVAPQELENQLKADRYISNAMIYGDKRPYLTALVVPDFESLQKYADYKKIDILDKFGLINHPQILDLLRRRINKIQHDDPSYQQIKRFTLLSRDFTGEKEEVTPTLKIKRDIIGQHFAKVIEDLYRTEVNAVHETSFCIVANETEVENP